MNLILRVLAVAWLLCLTAPAQFGPQWSGENPPRNGACFYNRSDYRGMYFCVGAGDGYAQLPNHFRKKISSIRIRGSAAVEFFDQVEFGGESFKTQQSLSDLSKLPFPAKTVHTWNDRVLSLRVSYDPTRSRPARTTGVALGTRPKQGACFFTEANFQGKSACLQTGESLERFPNGFDRAVASVRVYGHADVVVYEEAGFGGASEHLWSSVSDLASRVMAGDPYKTWQKRILSVEIR